MGRIIQQNNGKTTIYVTGEDFNNLSGTTDTYYVGVNTDSGNFEKKNPDGSTVEIGGSYNSVTYSELYNLFTGETLNPGSYYLINDFQTCYDQPDYDNTKTPITTGNYKTGTTEPILLLAVSTTGFSPTVYSTLYTNDKITYDITWNTTYITSSPAKGRITERIDNFNNRTDYDNRSILFKRYDGYSYNENNPLAGLIGISGITGTTGVLYGNTGTTFTSNFFNGDIVSVRNLDPSFFEVISVESDSIAIISGVTINETTDSPYYFGNNDGIMSYYQPNINQNQVYEYTTFGDAIDDGGAVNNYIGNYSNLHLEFGTGDFLLANNVLLAGSFRNNTIGNGSYNNTFNDDCDNNQIGDSFYNNSTNDDFDGNIIGENFRNNYITSNFNNNRIGSDFNSNTLLGGSFYRNNIGNNFNNNVWTNSDFQNNEIGNQFNDNKIYDDFYNNDIGNGYNNNESYSQFYRNLIGNGYNGNTIYSEFYENNIEHVFTNNTIGTLAEIGKYNFSKNKIGTDFESNIITQNFYKNEIASGFNNNSISGETSTNRIGEQFENNTIYGDFYDNNIFNEFKGNITYQDFYGNRLDWGFGSNQFSGFCVGNTFGPNIDSNDFFGIVFGNTFKGNVFGNTIGDNFAANNIGFGFISNTIGENFGYGAGAPQGNTIGNNFTYNTIGEYFYNNSIPDNFHDNIIGDYFQWNVINTNIDRTDFTLNYGNITGFSYSALGTKSTISFDGTSTNVTTTTNGIGVDATFNVEVSGGTVIGVTGNTEGRLYTNGDVLTILGTQINGVTGFIDGFSSDAVGKSGTTGSYTNIFATGTGGENATFDIDVAGDVVTDIYLNNGGGSYSVNETLTILGSGFGGVDGVDDITITVTSLYSDDVIITVTGTTPTPLFYEHYTKQIFERRLGDKRTSFYDEDDILNIGSVYENSGYIPVYSQSLTYPINDASFEFWCDGSYSNNTNYTGVDGINNSQELVNLFNSNYRSFGYFFDNNDGAIGLYINPSLKKQYCPTGTYTINVFND
jgi:hypothetical protein